MSTSAKTIKKGEIIILEDEPLPIHSYSAYHVPRAKVIPDGENFIKAKTSSGDFVVHKSETNLVHKALNQDGEYEYVMRGLFGYVTAEDKRGKTVFFIDERSAENNNFKFSFRLGRFHDSECDRFYGDDKLLRYHTQQQRIDRSRLPKFHDENDEYLVGVEVEKTDYALQNDGDAWKILTETGWSKEEDASLGSGGYELVSPILPLFNMEKIREASAPVKKWINASSNDTCGGHITLSRRGVDGEALLESFKQFAPILYSLYPNRLDNRYCRAKAWHKYFSYPEKYSAFYLKERSVGGRVEIRLFSRITNEVSMNWRLELLQMLIKDGGSLNQFAQKIGCSESSLYKHLAVHYTHTQIGEKLNLIDRYAKQYGTHRNGISPSVKKRINNTMGYEVFTNI